VSQMAPHLVDFYMPPSQVPACIVALHGGGDTAYVAFAHSEVTNEELGLVMRQNMNRRIHEMKSIGLECTMCGRKGHLAKDCKWGREVTIEAGSVKTWSHSSGHDPADLIKGEIGFYDDIITYVGPGVRFVTSPLIEERYTVLKGHAAANVGSMQRRMQPKLSQLTQTLRSVYPAPSATFS
jgi:hypothetical protein